MNIPKYSLENQKIIYFFLAVMLIGGIYSFFKLPKKEDSPFVIKQAVLVTQYPGATPQEVEKLVTERSNGRFRLCRMCSRSNLSLISVCPRFLLSCSLPCLRIICRSSGTSCVVRWRIYSPAFRLAPPRYPLVMTSVTYSEFIILTADEGYTYDDLRNWAQKIKTELSPVPGVQKVYLFGEQTQVVNVRSLSRNWLT